MSLRLSSFFQRITTSRGAGLPTIASGAIATILFGIIALLGAETWSEGEEAVGRARTNLHSVSHVAAEQTARTIQAIDSSLLGIIDARHYNTFGWQSDGPRVREFLREKAKQGIHIKDLFVADAHGSVVHTLREFAGARPNVSDREYFLAHRHDPARGLYINQPLINRLDGAWALFVSRRIENPEGDFDGIVVASVSIAGLRSAFDGVHLGHSAEISLFLENGALLLRSPQEDAAMGKGLVGLPRLADAEHEDVSLTRVSDVDEIRRIYALQRVPDMPIYVMIGIAEDELLAPWRRDVVVFLIMAATIVTVTGGLATVIVVSSRRREALLHALRDSEARFRDFAEAASDRFWESDAEHRLVWHSGLGETYPAFVGKTLWENVGVDPARDECWGQLKNDMDARRPFRGFQHMRAKGAQKLIRIVSGKPFFDASGKFLGYRGTYADITGQVSAQERLRLHRERFLRSIESMSEGFALYDAEDRLIVCNRRFQEYLSPVVASFAPGSSFEALLRESLALGLIPEAEGRRSAWLAQRLGEHRRLPSLQEVERSGRWVQIREQRDSEGGTMILVLDIHEQKTVELQRQALADRLRRLFDNMPVGCILVDEAFKITDWNPMAERIFGFSKSEMLRASPFETIVPPDAHRKVAAAVERTYTGKSMIVCEPGTNITKDGREIACEWFNTPLFDAEGRRSGMISMVLDVTAKRKAEEKLRQTTRMEAIGQLTGGIAHDFNNLLQVILGNSEILMDALADAPKLQRWAAMTKSAADRGADLTLRLLAYSRRQTLQPTNVDLNAAIIEMRHLLERALSSEVAIAFRLADDLWPAHVDASQIDHALLNLVLNARDAMPAGGALSVETANVSLAPADTGGEAPPGDYVRLDVRDTGNGMGPHVVARAFEPFFTTKDVGKGSGLGLSMVHGFVTQSGGLLRLASVAGKGTTVSIYFPRAPEAAAHPATGSRSHPAQGSGQTVLVVEDNELVRAYATSQLVELGYRVTEAANGPAAIKQLQQGCAFDLLFTDVIMPGGMNGRQLAKAAGRLCPGIRVLYTTGYDEDAISSDGRLPPGTFLLKKPYQRRDLASKVREALDSPVPA